MDKNAISQNSYIYGITIGGEVVYIGKTSRPINQRLREHALEAAHNQELENAMQQYDYEFVVLYESHNVISDEELCQIERTLIENIKPKYNILGVTKPYDLYSSKHDYRKRYRFLSDIEGYGLRDLYPCIKGMWIIHHKENLYKWLYKDGYIEAQNREAVIKEFGNFNPYGSPLVHCGRKGFIIKTDILGVERGNIILYPHRYLAKGDLTGLHGIHLPDSYAVYLWDETEEEFKNNIAEQLYQRYEKTDKEDSLELADIMYDFNYQLMVFEELFGNNYNDLKKRISAFKIPKAVKLMKSEDPEDFIWIPEPLDLSFNRPPES